MVAFGVDEAWSRLTPAEMKAAGKTFAVGYVSENTTGKNITPAEVAAHHAAGLGVILVYEYSITAAESGAAGGRANANLAVSQARDRHYPSGCALAFAIDEGSPSLSGLDAYSRAFTGVCHAAGYRSMVYGGLKTVRYCLDHGIVDLAWQTYAWSNGAWDSRAAIRQVQNGVKIAGKDVDLDTAMVDDFGAWMGTDMPLTAADVALIWGYSIPNTDSKGSGDRVAKTVVSEVFNHVTGQYTWPESPLGQITPIGAGEAVRDAALLAAVQALGSGGASLDTVAVINAVREAGDRESAAVSALQAQVADLKARLSAAGQALA